MKRKWHHPEADVTPNKVTDRKYWRSYDELEDTPDFRDWLEREFPRGAAQLSGPEADEPSRRGFLKYMGASASLAGLGLASCRRPEQYLVAYNEHVEHIIPGKALFYSSAMPKADGCVPLVVTTYEGRPTKVDGNRLHPEMKGGTDQFVQASVLDLYDPDRSRDFLHNGEKSSAEAFKSEFLDAYIAAKGEKSAILVGASTSPTRDQALKDLQAKFPGAKLFQYEPLVSVEKQEADLALYGEGVSASPRFDKAERILSLDSDFMGTDPQGEDPGSQWAAGRKPGDGMSRLYIVESAFTVTGGAADHRLRIPATQVVKVAAMLAAKVGEFSNDGALKAEADKLLAKFSPKIFNEKWVEEAAKDLVASKGKALVVSNSRQSTAVQVLTGMMNKALGAIGANKPLQLFKHGRKPLPGISDLAKAIEGGEVETLISLTPADIVYDAPADLKIEELLGKVKTLVHSGIRPTLTAGKATWHVPGAHYLEAWGDAQTSSGIYSVIQPMILPLFGGWSELDFLLALLQEPPAEVAEGEEAPAPKDATLVSMEAVKAAFDKFSGGGNWNMTLRDGFFDKKPYAPVNAAPLAGAAAALSKTEIADHPHAGALEVVLATSSQVFDGRYSNNSWLQEAPEAISKLTWDNAAIMSKKTADDLGVGHDGDNVAIRVGEGEPIIVPAFRLPGHADFSITLSLGYYGKAGLGNINKGAGFNAYPLKTTASPYTVSGAKVNKTMGTYPLAPTAIHWSMQGRAIAREGTNEMFKDDPEFAQNDGMDGHIPENISLYKGPDYNKSNEDQPERNAPFQRHEGFKVDELHQWAMTIDLNTCIGCNACTVACQAENNIPIVGKEQVMMGREMHWIRMDRYFSSPREGEPSDLGMSAQKIGDPGTRGRPAHDDDNLEMITQPVACVQCENAPCETVCPVNATVHSSDGLNAMTYNRCIGTRYCANNCPYKARRFNYFDYNKRHVTKTTDGIGNLHLGPLAAADGIGTTATKLQKNPNVSVRMRGVIEKCTYCVQRIQAAKIDAKAKARDSRNTQVPANKVRTACQDACPTEAINFGNLKNPKDNILTTRGSLEEDYKDADPRNYDLLKYVGTRPRTSYLAKVRNPNPAMPGQEHVGQATAHMH